jgi:FKBP-type peptidyl-prolyl cis-trans isomerase 2
MFKYIILASLIALSSCTKPMMNTRATTSSGAPVTTNSSTTASPNATVQSWVTNIAPSEMMKNPTVALNYTLREDSPTGKILETTKEDVAKANNLYKSGGTYEPFEVTLGTSAVIPGFERGIASMKKGEKKTIEVLPKDGYGETNMKRTVRDSEVAPEFTVTTDRSQFEDTAIQTVQKNLLGEQWKNLVIGQTLTGGANVTAKVTKIDGENVTLMIDNKENPFYGKKLVVWATATKDKITFTVKTLTDKEVTMFIINGNSPFAGKKFIVGAMAPIPTNNGQPSPWNIKVLAISGESIDIDIPNNHPLAGKTLYFDIEIIDIK